MKILQEYDRTHIIPYEEPTINFIDSKKLRYIPSKMFFEEESINIFISYGKISVRQLIKNKNRLLKNIRKINPNINQYFIAIHHGQTYTYETMHPIIHDYYTQDLNFILPAAGFNRGIIT